MVTAAEKLKAARLQKNLSLEDVSKATKIKVTFLDYIEKGEYSKLPSVSYAQGFVKNYVRYLGLNEEELMALFRREFSGEKAFSVLPKSFEKTEEFSVSRFKIGRSFILIALVFLIFFGYLLFQYRGAIFNPALTIISPKPGAVIYSSEVRVVGKTDPDATVYVDKNEVSVDPNGNFSKTINVFPGSVTIDVQAINKFRKQTEKSVTINVRGS